ncbi:MAG: sarcosine oxidase subunit gamma [Rhodobacteraceae bacterium]|nr:sarcosine oxidase subunit gamma [Paracoccaceae bacterium]
MSEPVTALGGVSHDGLVHIKEAPLQGMITLRGDLSSTAVQNAATGVAAVDMPGKREANCVDQRGICWMSPDELLVLCPYDTVTANVTKMTATLGTVHALVVDVSDARASFRVKGPLVRDVMAKLCPIDLSKEIFKNGHFRRTRLAQVTAAFWMRDTETVQLICFRSVAGYVFDVLKAAASQNSAVPYF